jgi:hypothetical protein
MWTRALLISLAMALSNAPAAYEIEGRVTALNYDFGRYAEFNVNLYQIGVSKFYGDTGVSVLVGESDRDSHGRNTGEVKNFWVMSLEHRFRLSDQLTLAVRYNYTEYKSALNGRFNPDTGSGFGVGIIHRLSRDYSVKLSYDDYYRKAQPEIGGEKTYGAGVSFTRHY